VPLPGIDPANVTLDVAGNQQPPVTGTQVIGLATCPAVARIGPWFLRGIRQNIVPVALSLASGGPSRGKYVSADTFFTITEKSIAAGDTNGFIKVLFDANSDRLLGAHLIGPEVTELVQGFVIAMTPWRHGSRSDRLHLPAPYPVRVHA
jgi:hypothetical protein